MSNSNCDHNLILSYEAEIKALKAKVRRLEFLIRQTSEYEIHEDGCDVVVFDFEAESRPCTCLLEVLRKEVSSTEEDEDGA